MDIDLIIPLVEQIKGVTFATLNATTRTGSSKAIRCVTTGERVLLFRTNDVSGYERMVQRRLAEAGKNPDLFQVGPLPWGERVGNLPIIKCNGNYYLQCVELHPGQRKYFIGNDEEEILSSVVLQSFGIKSRMSYNQGLPQSEQVKVSTYDIRNIDRLVLMGEEVGDTLAASKRDRTILRINIGGKNGLAKG